MPLMIGYSSAKNVGLLICVTIAGQPVGSACRSVPVLLEKIAQSSSCSPEMQTSGVNFINFLCTAFTHVDPKSVKRY